MKILIITAHPSESGFTHKIADSYKKALENNEHNGNEVEILDLYDTKIRQDFLNFENKKNIEVTSEIQFIQNKIKNADELVFVFPIWWADAPAIVKNFIDTNFNVGFAFKYTEKGPIGLLNGKTAKIFATCDGPGFYYKFPIIPLKLIWGKARLGFCGIKLQKFVIFDKMRIRTDEEKEKMLKKVTEIASKSYK